MAQPVISRAGKMKRMNTKVGNQSASCGTTSILSKYKGSAKIRVSIKAKLQAQGARLKALRTPRQSNAARKRFSMAIWVCSNGRCRTTIAKSRAPKKPTKGERGVFTCPKARSVTGIISQNESTKRKHPRHND